MSNTTIADAQKLVHGFHEHVKVVKYARLTECGMRDTISNVASVLKSLASHLQPFVDDPLACRAHLLTEELGEMLEAMVENDEVRALDGAADLLYVLLGTAAIFDWPLAQAFDEVHASNMTKERQPDDPHAARVRAKGPNYRPPNIESILHSHRNGQV